MIHRGYDFAIVVNFVEYSQELISLYYGHLNLDNAVPLFEELFRLQPIFTSEHPISGTSPMNSLMDSETASRPQQNGADIPLQQIFSGVSTAVDLMPTRYTATNISVSNNKIDEDINLLVISDLN